MARKLLMTWNAKRKGWLKHYRGKIYNVSCRQLGTEPTKEASWEAANSWWEAKRLELETNPNQDVREREKAQAAFKVWTAIQDWHKMDEPTRRLFAESVLGKEQVATIYGNASNAADQLLGKASDPDRRISAQVETWGRFLLAGVAAGQFSDGRYDAYLRNVGIFSEWAGPDAPVDCITAAKLETFFQELSSRVQLGVYSRSYAHGILMTAKQWISWLAERGTIDLPGNIRSRRFRFNNGAARIETLSVEEVKALLKGCEGFSERTQLYLLLGLNCGMYQMDVAELEDREVDLTACTVTRPRSKTPDGPTVTYRLWPEPLNLLRKHQARMKVKGQRGGNLWLLTDEGQPLVKYWLEHGKFRRYDVIQSAWSRLKEHTGIKKAFKLLRKTSASKLAEHASYKFYVEYFLGHSPRSVADKHYRRPSDKEFFEACDWLRGQLLG